MSFFSDHHNPHNQGQTLIETIVAIAILTTGIIGGLALAISALSSADRVTNEIIATNLAREGLEGMRYIRDSNWLLNDLKDCDYIASGQDCVPEWANFGGAACNSIIPFLNYNENAGTTSGVSSCRNYRVSINSANGIITSENQGSGFTESNYRLNLVNGVYTHSNGTATDFYRRVRVFRDENPPFSEENFRIRIESIAWWKGRGCQNVTSTEIDTNCKVVVEDYLTNWKDY